MRERFPPPRRRSHAPLVSLLVFQLAGISLLGGYVYAEHQPLDPDHGLRQLDLISLHQRVGGLPDVAGVATLVAISGTGAACAAKVAEAGGRRNATGGIPDRYGLVVVLEGSDSSEVRSASSQIRGAGIVLRPDPSGALAGAVALPAAATGCTPGYAVVDPGGFVRYRTYDPNWQRHGGEESILLAAVS